jgi:homopolymeric O-antigen transport system ATP-binding protein
MSSEARVAIRARGVSKLYRRGQMASSGLLAERLNNAVLSPVRRLLGRSPSTEDIISDHEQEAPETDEFWALKDVSFDVHFGEAVGIIGRNGAGKSTMLKLLSRITLPTEGRIELHGRTTSLLEVGTGFHPELTGRENIFLNGTLLGLNRWDIFERYEEIVEFSGIRPFIDTPVKRYSSGMFVRLAFSVAAHLDPEILIIDEVLAVGDMDFQQRSLEKMQQTAAAGRTVVFVSHDLSSIENICDRVLVLEGGQIVSESRSGHPHDAVDDYVGMMDPDRPRAISRGTTGGKKHTVELVRAWATNRAQEDVERFSIFEDVYLHVLYAVTEDLSDAVIPFFHVLDRKGDYVFLAFPHNWPAEKGRRAGRYEAVCHIPAHLLNDGSYSVTAQVNTVSNGHTLQFFEEHALRFVILDDIRENPHRAHTKFSYELPGAVRPLLDWQLIPADQLTPAIDT